MKPMRIRRVTVYYASLCLTMVVSPISFLVSDWLLQVHDETATQTIHVAMQQLASLEKTTHVAHVTREAMSTSSWLTHSLEVAQRHKVKQQLLFVSDSQLRLRLLGTPADLREWIAESFQYWPSNPIHPLVISSVTYRRVDHNKAELSLDLIDSEPAFAALDISIPMSTRACELKGQGQFLGVWHEHKLVATLATDDLFSAYFQNADGDWIVATSGDYFRSPTTVITEITRESVAFKQLEYFPCAITTFQSTVKRANDPTF